MPTKAPSSPFTTDGCRVVAPRCAASADVKFGPALGIVALLIGCAGGQGAAATRAEVPGAGSRWLQFACASGRPIAAHYAAGGRTVLVRRGGQEYRMELARSASGARYAGAGLEWWTKGSGPGASGSLLRHAADGGPGATLDRCTQQ